MYALTLVQHLQVDAESMSQQLLERTHNSSECSELPRRVPLEDHKRYALDVYRDLIDWFVTETDSLIEARYVKLGRLRAQQRVPFSHLFWAVCITRDLLSDYIQQECLIDDRWSLGWCDLAPFADSIFRPCSLLLTHWPSKRQRVRVRQFARRLTIEVMAP